MLRTRRGGTSQRALDLQRGVGMENSVYLKALQEWDARYADLVLGKRNWQISGR